MTLPGISLIITSFEKGRELIISLYSIFPLFKFERTAPLFIIEISAFPNSFNESQIIL